jgi:hypothetical protein
MATRLRSGTAVKRGYYLDLAGWTVQPISRDGDRLPEGKGTWTPIPTAAALALVPLMGALFLVFLPFIGFALTLRALAKPLIGVLHASATGLAAAVSPGWQPGEMHFTGKREARSGVDAQGPPADDRLGALAREIEAVRRRS